MLYTASRSGPTNRRHKKNAPSRGCVSSANSPIGLLPLFEESNAEFAWANDRRALAPPEGLEICHVVVELSALVKEVITEEVEFPIFAVNTKLHANSLIALHNHLRCVTAGYLLNLVQG